MVYLLDLWEAQRCRRDKGLKIFSAAEDVAI